MLCAVKYWARCRRVNTTYEGTLSSYAYVLMVIHFLQVDCSFFSPPSRSPFAIIL